MVEPITVLDVLFDTFGAVLVLCVVGYSSVRLVEIASRRRLTSFADELFGLSSDYTLKLSFFMYVGVGFILLYVKILSVFRVVSTLTLGTVLLLSFGVAVFDLLRKKSLPDTVRAFIGSKGLRPLIVMLAFLVFLTVFKAPAIVGEYGSTEHDAAYHSLLILDILRNQMEVTSYPQGSHMVAAFLTSVLGIPVYRVVSLLTFSFSVMIFLGFYSLAVSHLSRPVYGCLAGCLGCLFWNNGFDAVAWGGLPYETGVYVIVSLMAFSTKIILLKEGHVLESVFYGSLLFIPLFAVYPIPVLFEAVWLTLLLLRSVITSRQYLTTAKTMGVIALCLALSVFPWMDYLYFISPSFSSFFRSSGGGGISSADLSGLERNNRFNLLIFMNTVGFKEYIDGIVNGKSFGLIAYGMLVCVVVLVLAYVWRHRGRGKTTSGFLDYFSPTSGIMLLYYLFLVAVYLYIRYVDVYRFFPTFRVVLYEGVAMVMLETLSIIMFWTLLDRGTHQLLEKIRISLSMPRKAMMLKASAIVIISIMFVSSVNLTEPMNIVADNSLGLPDSHSVLTEDDVELQLWMKKNIPYSIVVMASCADAGQYVPVIAEKETIVTYGQYKFYADSMYGKLLYLLSTSPELAFEDLKAFNVTHIYVGAKKTESGPTFDALKIQNTQSPHCYRLIHQIGNAYLFEVLYGT